MPYFIRLVIIVVFINKTCIALSGGRICLSCDRVVKPRDCTTLTVCGPHEQCSVEEYVSSDGIPWFRVGCRDNTICSSSIFGRKRQASLSLQLPKGASPKRNNPVLEDDLIVCTKCCNDRDLCNDNGCGVQGINYNLGTVCYGCSQASGPDSCDRATMCFQDQDCYVGRKRVGFDLLYEMKCFSKTGCASIHPYVGACCNTTLCNRQLSTYNPNAGKTTAKTTGRTSNAPQQTSTTTPFTTSSTTVKTTSSSKYTTKATTKLQTTQGNPNATCSKWINFPQMKSRYCLVTKSGFEWYAAKNLCNRNGMHLPIIDNDAEYHFLEQILKQNSINVWLDGTDRKQEGMWTWSSTGDVIIQKHWDANQPDSYQGTEEDCLEMGVAYNLRWNDAECSRQLSVLCEDGYRHHLKTLPDCQTGWKSSFNLLYCYEDVRIDWYSAQDYCRSRYDAHLPIVDFKAKQDFLSSTFSSKNIWLDGSEEDHQGHWQWVSTKHWFRDTFWNPGEPNDYGGVIEQCLETGPRDGWRWNDAPCSWTNRTDGVVCERTDPIILG